MKSDLTTNTNNLFHYVYSLSGIMYNQYVQNTDMAGYPTISTLNTAENNLFN